MSYEDYPVFVMFLKSDEMEVRVILILGLFDTFETVEYLTAFIKSENFPIYFQFLVIFWTTQHKHKNVS